MDPFSAEPALTVTTDPQRIDFDLICREIQNTYWGLGRTREIIPTSMENSICFSLFYRGFQVGFARVITDLSTFAYLCDVFIVPQHQRKGFGSFLMKTVMNHHSLNSVKWILRTRDAHKLYEKCGFFATLRPERYMER